VVALGLHARSFGIDQAIDHAIPSGVCLPPHKTRARFALPQLKERSTGRNNASSISTCFSR
jgi:hypothetical protein